MATSSLPPCVKLTGGKRGAPGPLIVTTSDEDSCSDGELPQASPRAPLASRISPRSNLNDTFHPNLKLDLQTVIRTDARSETKTDIVRPRASSPSPTPNPHQQAFDGYEHDHDYENVASPSGSSTASGPVYVRPPGFQHHAHEFRQETRRKKKKPTGLLNRREGIKSRAPTPPKVRARRDPVPMRQRALPQSFWKQPNNPPALSPGSIFSSLPPLSGYIKDDDVTDDRPVTPTEDKDKIKRHPKVPERKVIVTGDADMFLKHLFAGVTDEKKTVSQLKRGRPKKVHSHKPPITKGLLSGDDPYLIDSAITQKLFPQLSLESSTRPGGNTSLQLITLREGDKSVTLPSLSIEQNYSQMLSELVMNI